MAKHHRMSFKKAITEALENSFLSMLCLASSILFLMSAIDTINLLDPDSIIISFLLLNVALILLICTILTSLSKIIADSVGFAFAKKGMSGTNSRAEFFLMELVEQLALVTFPSTIASLSFSHSFFNSSGLESEVAYVIGSLILFVTVIACMTKAISDGIATGLKNSGNSKLVLGSKTNNSQRRKSKTALVADNQGQYEWYEDQGQSFYRILGSNDEWILHEG